MSEYAIVPHALIRPFTCVKCAGSDGPLIDTGRELPVYGRVYECERCAKQTAARFGFVKGKRMQELSEAARLLDTARSANEAQSEHIAELTAKLEERDRQLADVTADNDRLASHAESLRQRLKDITAQTAALAEV